MRILHDRLERIMEDYQKRINDYAGGVNQNSFIIDMINEEET